MAGTYSVTQINIENNINGDPALTFTPGPTAGYVLSINSNGSTKWALASGGGGGSQNLDQVLSIGNTTSNLIEFYDVSGIVGAAIAANNIATVAEDGITLAGLYTTPDASQNLLYYVNNLGGELDVSANTASTSLQLQQFQDKSGFIALTSDTINKYVSIPNSAHPPLNTDITDVYEILNQNTNITDFTINVTGTPVAGQMLVIMMTTAAGTHGINWGSLWENGQSHTLPTTISPIKTTAGFIWNTATHAWRCVGVD